MRRTCTGLVYAVARSDESFGRRSSSLDHKRNDMFWNLTTTFEPALVPPNVVLGDDRSYDVLDFDDEDNEHEDVADWNNDGDLPHDFTTDYCENLAAMLLLWPEHVD